QAVGPGFSSVGRGSVGDNQLQIAVLEVVSCARLGGIPGGGNFRRLRFCFYRLGYTQQLIISGREITILIQVSDYEFCRCPNSRTNIHGAELPKQMISKSGRLGKKIFKGRALYIFEVASAAVTGIKIVAEKRTKIYLVEWIFFFFRRSSFTIR